MIQPLCCERIEVELGDYLEGALPRPLRLRVESHLAICPECWREVQKLRYTITCLADLPRHPMPLQLKQSILRARSGEPAHSRPTPESGLLPLSQRS